MIKEVTVKIREEERKMGRKERKKEARKVGRKEGYKWNYQIHSLIPVLIAVTKASTLHCLQPFLDDRGPIIIEATRLDQGRKGPSAASSHHQRPKPSELNFSPLSGKIAQASYCDCRTHLKETFEPHAGIQSPNLGK